MTRHDDFLSESLAGARLLISGGSRGIGLAMALRAAQDGAAVALLAKTATPHPKLPGTVFTAADAIEEAGGTALPIVGDVRDEAVVTNAVSSAVEEFGGLDIVINNASAMDLSASLELPIERYDLMQDVNARGAFLMTRTAVPHLRESTRAHVLTLSPPLELQSHWAARHLGYSMSKWGMSLTTLGFASEFAEGGVGVNSLWPRTLIATAAVDNVLGSEHMARARTPKIMADAAHYILTRDPKTCTGNFFIDEEVLRARGVSDFAEYRHDEAAADEDLELDIFIES